MMQQCFWSNNFQFQISNAQVANSRMPLSSNFKLSRYRRELSAAAAYAALLSIVGIVAPSFFSATNVRDLMMNNAPVLIVAIGMTMVILAGQIDISVGS